MILDHQMVTLKIVESEVLATCDNYLCWLHGKGMQLIVRQYLILMTFILQERPEKFCFTTSNSSAEPCELSYDKGEKLWVISQDATR